MAVNCSSDDIVSGLCSAVCCTTRTLFLKSLIRMPDFLCIVSDAANGDDLFRVPTTRQPLPAPGWPKLAALRASASSS